MTIGTSVVGTTTVGSLQPRGSIELTLVDELLLIYNPLGAYPIDSLNNSVLDDITQNQYDATSSPSSTVVDGWAQFSSGVDDEYEVPSSANPDWYSGENVTYGVKFRTNSAGVMYSSSGGGHVPAISIDDQGFIGISIHWHGDTAFTQTPNGGYNDGNIHTIIGTFENGTETLYVDGQQVDQRTGLSQDDYGNGSYTYTLGSDPDGAWNALPGNLPQEFTGEIGAFYSRSGAIDSSQVGDLDTALREERVLPSDADTSQIAASRLRDVSIQSVDEDISVLPVGRDRALLINSLNEDSAQFSLDRLTEFVLDSDDSDISSGTVDRSRQIVFGGDDRDSSVIEARRLRDINSRAFGDDASSGTVNRERDIIFSGEDEDVSQNVLDRVTEIVTDVSDVDVSQNITIDRVRTLSVAPGVDDDFARFSVGFFIALRVRSSDEELGSAQFDRVRQITTGASDEDALILPLNRLTEIVPDVDDADISRELVVDRLRELVSESLDPDSSQTPLRRARLLDTRSFEGDRSVGTLERLRSLALLSDDEDATQLSLDRVRVLEPDTQDEDRSFSELARQRVLDTFSQDEDVSTGEVIRQRNIVIGSDDNDLSVVTIKRFREVFANSTEEDISTIDVDRKRLLSVLSDDETDSELLLNRARQLDFSAGEDEDDFVTQLLRQRDVDILSDDEEFSEGTVDRQRDIEVGSDDEGISVSVLERLRELGLVSDDDDLSTGVLDRERSLFVNGFDEESATPAIIFAVTKVADERVLVREIELSERGLKREIKVTERVVEL